MKMNLTKKLMAASLMMFMLLGLSNRAFAQGDAFTSFILAAPADAEKVLTLYTAPLLKGFGHGINTGWNNTAKPHKLLGFDATVTVSGIQVPDSDLEFTFNQSDFSTMTLGSGAQSGSFPTIFGSSEAPLDQIQLTFDSQVPGIDPISTDIPLAGTGIKDAIGYAFVPVPMATVGIGLIKGTEIRFRYIPEIALGEGGTIGLFGIGVKHDIKQWIPVIKNLPFDLSGFVGYTSLKFSYAIDSEKGTPADAPIVLRNNSDNQAITFESTGTVFQALVSKKLLFLTPYVGLGYTRMKTEFKIAGDYSVFADPLGTGNYVEAETFTDPLVLSVSEGSLQGIVGLRLKVLWVLAIHAEYTLQKYNAFTFGIGINIR